MTTDGIQRSQAQFGQAADAYATSEVHATGESLALLLDGIREVVGRAEGPVADSALDIATGAGHTAIALAPHVGRMVATDVTEQMLEKTRELATAAGASNVETAYAAAGDLPFDDAAFDLATCRLAFHHFEDQSRAAAEMARVLRPGGIFGFTDNLTVQDPTAAEFYNAYERLRDPSHNRVLSLANLIGLLEEAGFVVQYFRRLSKEFDFHPWADRQRVGPEGKQALLAMMKEAPAALLPIFAPRWERETMYFSLWEAVIVAAKV